VLGDERLGVDGGTLERRQVPFVADVAQGHTNIPQETAAFDSPDGGTAEEIAEGDVIEREVIA
jgi:hypothetical protein